MKSSRDASLRRPLTGKRAGRYVNDTPQRQGVTVVGKLLFSLACIVMSMISSGLWASEKLVIISPHRKSIQSEFIPVFQNYYKKNFGKNIEVEWVDQGGTENDLRYIRSKFKSNPATSQIDIFWGGGDVTFRDLEAEGLLIPAKLPAATLKELPRAIAGIPLASTKGLWYASALSSFGIFYNKTLLKMLSLPTPQTWADLTKAEYFGQVSMADPRHSASALIMYMIVLFGSSWDQGWETLSKLAGNTQKFTHSSSDPIKAVVSGEVSIATAVDFYAYAKVHELGADKLGFVLPKGQTLINTDPIAVLKGAPHTLQAERFISFVLSKEAQKLLVLPQGQPEGPRWSALWRMAVNPAAYEGCKPQINCALNPFAEQLEALPLQAEKLAESNDVVRDLLGAVYIDLHAEVQKAWQAVLRQGSPKALVARFSQAPLSEAELLAAAKRWNDQSYRNQMLSRWTSEAKKRYVSLASGKSLSS